MAATPEQVRADLQLITGAAVGQALDVALSSGEFDTILSLVPGVVDYYSDGSSALAADWYDEIRDEASAPGRYVAAPVVADRSEKLRKALLWAVEPLKDADATETRKRVEPVVQKAVARPFWDTVTDNTAKDDAAVGWSRHTRPDGCAFCRMLAGRGAVYKQSTVRFASHGNCHCTARPEFGDGPEASTLQYVASQRRRSEAEQARLRDYLKSQNA